MRNNIIAGNWKMNKTLSEAKALLKGLKKEIKNVQLHNTRVIISPSFVNLRAMVNRTEKTTIEVAAQNLHHENAGAFTGEVAANMLTDIGVKTVILGHSERRTYSNETNALLAKKVNTALTNNLEIIFCFGEVLEDRKSNKHFTVVQQQLSEALFHLKATAFTKIILAYEPVWAIGTGETASPEQAQEMHAFVRNLISEKYTSEIANNISILYGGSVKPANAKEIFSKPDVDGGLIGGAALNVNDFIAIIKAI